MNRFNKYRIMWVTVLFDLPTETKLERKVYSTFRKHLLNDGFIMLQYSVYTRHCVSYENAEVHVNRVKAIVPEYGEVRIFKITDKQFAEMEIIFGKKPRFQDKIVYQLELF